MKIVTVLGTRPEIIKLSPLLPRLDQNFNHILVHTNQHYDHNMDSVFFEELQLRKPSYFLQVGSHPPGKQTGMMLEKIEQVLVQEKPQLVIVQGDTNSTLAGALAAAKLFIPIMHVESGCRSYSTELPEEINKTLVPHISSFLISPDDISSSNLLTAGIPATRIRQYGSTAFDAALRNAALLDSSRVLQELQLQDPFILVTIHRAENTNNVPRLKGFLHVLNTLADKTTVVFPMHPRTKKVVQEQNLSISPKVRILEPQSYLRFLSLLSHCSFCLSDSGGIQEEALIFNKPCLVLRNETEWMRLVNARKNILVGTDPNVILRTALTLLETPAELDRIRRIHYPYETGVAEKIITLIQEYEGNAPPNNIPSNIPNDVKDNIPNNISRGQE